MTFLLVMLHTGTMVAVLVYYWRRWKGLLFSPTKADESRPSPLRFVLAVLLATAVTGALGLSLKVVIERVILEQLMGRQNAEMEELFKNIPLLGTALLLVGILILAASYYEGRNDGRPLSWATSLWIGLIQGFSLVFRGFSRSGATISLGMIRGLSRHLAEEFSFALAVLLTPPVIGYSMLRLLKKNQWPTGDKLIELLKPGLIGMVLSCLAGLIALRLLSAMLDKGRWKYFGYYCVVAAGVMYAAHMLLPTAPAK
jgi:undecaprenyl-diphosphatase